MSMNGNLAPHKDRETEFRMFNSLNLRLYQLYALFGNPTEVWDVESEHLHGLLPEHALWLRGLEKSGTMFMGGPFRAHDDPWDGSGMMLARAGSLEDAKAIAAGDPLVIHGLRRYDVRGWQLNEGRIVLTLDLDSNVIDVG